MNYKDRMNAIGKASRPISMPQITYGPPREWSQYPEGDPIWSAVSKNDRAGIARILIERDPSLENPQNSEVVERLVNKLITVGPPRALDDYFRGVVGIPEQDIPNVMEDYYKRQRPVAPPKYSLPIERPDFSQPPMGGGSTRNVQWEGPGNPSWERRMRERAMGGMR